MKRKSSPPRPEPAATVEESPAVSFRPSGADLLRTLALVALSVVIWCTAYNRWSVANWETPIAYTGDVYKSDVLGGFAGFKAAEDGHYFPVLVPLEVPELNAPYTANWNDYPVPEKPLIWCTGLVARVIGLFPAANFAVLLASVLAAVSFYAAGRLLGVDWVWAFAGALIFAFARFIFAHGLHHLVITYYWHLPLCLVAVDWAMRGPGLRFGGKKFYFALAVAIVTGAQNIYYTSIFAQFLFWAGLVQGWRRGWDRALPAAAVIGAMLGVFALINSNTFIYELVHGPAAGTVDRVYAWLEIYGLKLVDLVIPPPDHRWPLFAAWGAHHLHQVLLSPGEIPVSGYLGLAGLAALGWLVFVSLRNGILGGGVPLEAYLILWLVIEGGVGGLNGLLGTFGLLLFRSTTRYSIVILAIVLFWAVRRLSGGPEKKPLIVYAAAALITFAALLDQTPVTSQAEIDALARAVDNDRSFAAAMEARLPSGAMIFQLPVLDFPESGMRGIGPGDHLRPYLFTHGLRYSFGTDKGRPREAWQREVMRQPLPDAVQQLENYGFSAIYVNRKAFTDGGAELWRQLQQAGITERIDDREGSQFCVFLNPSTQPTLPVQEIE